MFMFSFETFKCLPVDLRNFLCINKREEIHEIKCLINQKSLDSFLCLGDMAGLVRPRGEDHDLQLNVTGN